MADLVNFKLMQGDDTSRIWQVKNAGLPADLTGAIVTAYFKSSAYINDSAPSGVYPLTGGSGLEVVDVTAGKIELDIPTGVTAEPGMWFYKIRVAETGDAQTAIYGWLTVDPA